MTGDERERACQLCHLNVYNISTMSSKEAESFLQERLPKGRVCVRLYRRADGTIITDNCPKGLQAARDAARFLTRRAAAAVSLLLTVLIGAPSQAQNGDSNKVPMMGKPASHSQGEPIMGDVAMPTPVMGKPAPITTMMGAPTPIKTRMGALAPMGMGHYMEHLNSKIPKLSLPPGCGPIKVAFKIHEDGTLSDIKVDHSSGDVNLDNVACDLIRNAAPTFEKIPPSIGAIDILYTFK